MLQKTIEFVTIGLFSSSTITAASNRYERSVVLDQGSSSTFTSTIRLSRSLPVTR